MPVNIMYVITGLGVADSVASASKSASCDIALFGCQLEASTLFTALSALAAVVSVVFLYRSIRASITANKNDQRAREAEIKHRYYDEMVTSRVFPALGEFRKLSKNIVDKNKNKINELYEDNASTDEMHSTIKNMVNEFQNLRAELMEEISEPLDAWGDERIRSEVRDVIEDMEDNAASMFENLMYRESKDPNIKAEINKKTGMAERIIRDNDPFVTEINSEQ